MEFFSGSYRQKLAYLLFLPLCSIIYHLLNHNYGRVFNLVTDIDRLIPFVTYFILPYLFWYPFLIAMLLYFCFKNEDMYKKQVWVMIAGQAVCFVIYFLFQTTVPRPPVPGNDIWSQLVRSMYSFDNPFNAFPSIHVLTSYSLLKGCYNTPELSLFLRGTTGITSLFIIVSTLFLKQHTILDAIASIAIVNTLVNLYDIYLAKGTPAWSEKILLSSPGRIKLPG